MTDGPFLTEARDYVFLIARTRGSVCLTELSPGGGVRQSWHGTVAEAKSQAEKWSSTKLRPWLVLPSDATVAALEA